jgi:hypothetical protein
MVTALCVNDEVIILAQDREIVARPSPLLARQQTLTDPHQFLLALAPGNRSVYLSRNRLVSDSRGGKL